MPRSTPFVARRAAWILLALVLGGCAGRRAMSDACAPCAPVCDPCAQAAPPCPPPAQPGEAWCRVWIPPVHKTVVEQVCVCPERREKVRVPAQYGSRPKIVCVEGPRVRERIQPAVWTTRTRDVCVLPERQAYRKVCCPPGELCPCEQQAECYRIEACPPVFRQECEPVCLAPSVECVEYAPAKYRVVEERFEIAPAQCEERVVPARYETRTRQVCCRPGRWEWRRNEACEVPEPGLPALEVEMVDRAASGAEEGVFEEGDLVRYDLIVRSDVGSEAFPRLRIVFTLPPQLTFVSGGGEVAVTGSGQDATSDVFQLSLDTQVEIHVLARVDALAPTAFVQATASIQTEDGAEVARETESTTLAAPGEK